MDLSKDNIVSRYFSKQIVGGLNEFEVRDFLHVLAEEIRHLKQLSKDQNQKLTDQEELIRDYRDREHILKQSISSAQEVSDKIRRDAEGQAQLILEKAQDKSDSLIQEARHSLQSVYNDIADLKRLHLQFKTSLKAALQTQLELLEQGPLFASSLADNSGREALENKEITSGEEQNPSSEGKSPSPSSSDHSFLGEEPISEDTIEDSLNISPDEDEDLKALKSSLKSLDKDFS